MSFTLQKLTMIANEVLHQVDAIIESYDHRLTEEEKTEIFYQLLNLQNKKFHDIEGKIDIPRTEKENHNLETLYHATHDHEGVIAGVDLSLEENRDELRRTIFSTLRPIIGIHAHEMIRHRLENEHQLEKYSHYH